MVEGDQRQAARAVAERCAELLKSRFGAKQVILFGSVTGRGPWHERSDIDLAVEGMPAEDFFRAWVALDEVIPRGMQIDLVALEDASPELRARILGEVGMEKSPILALKGLVEDELRALARVAERMGEVLKTLSDEPNQFELRGIAAYLHEFYTGVESILDRIATWLDEEIPRGEAWHGELLNQMASEREGVRPAILDDSLRACLREYLKFRHFFRHAYGHELSWVKMRPLAVGMEDALARLERRLREFFATLVRPGGSG